MHEYTKPINVYIARMKISLSFSLKLISKALIVAISLRVWLMAINVKKAGDDIKLKEFPP